MGDEIMKIEIEEEEVPMKTPESDIREELRQIGQQFGETLRTAWASEERQRVESELKEGFQAFASEVEKAFSQARQGDRTRRVREEAQHLREDIRSGELRTKARGNLMQGLKWLSSELDKLADRFTPVEKGPEDIK